MQHLIQFKLLLKLNVHRLRMAADHWHPRHRRGDRNLRSPQDFPCLVDQLLLLGSVAVLLKIAAVRKEVAVDRVWVGHVSRFAPLFGLKLADGLLAGAGHALVC